MDTVRTVQKLSISTVIGDEESIDLYTYLRRIVTTEWTCIYSPFSDLGLPSDCTVSGCYGACP